MKVFYSNHIPFKGFRAINLFGIVIARREYGKLPQRIIRHETIHSYQMLELLIVGFYLWYLLEWMIKLMAYRNGYLAYKNISFEREAYAHDEDPTYLKQRPHWNFLKYVSSSETKQ